MDTGSNNWNEREGGSKSGMDRRGKMENKNKIKYLLTERCENIGSLYINTCK